MNNFEVKPNENTKQTKKSETLMVISSKRRKTCLNKTKPRRVKPLMVVFHRNLFEQNQTTKSETLMVAFIETGLNTRNFAASNHLKEKKNDSGRSL